MLRFWEYTDEQKDSVDLSDEQRMYLLALGLRDACSHIGK